VLDRRSTSFTLNWNAPAETTGGYDIHVKKASTAPVNPCGTEVKAVPFAGTPKATGMAETIPVTGLYIENTYCFTVAAKDAVGTGCHLLEHGSVLRRFDRQPRRRGRRHAGRHRYLVGLRHAGEAVHLQGTRDLAGDVDRYPGRLRHHHGQLLRQRGLGLSDRQ